MDAVFAFSYRPPVAALAITGGLDSYSRGQLAWRLIDLEALGTDVVLLDLGRVDHIDLDSLRMIDDTRRKLLARGAALELGSVTPTITMLCNLAGYVALAAQAERLGDDPRLSAR